MLMYLPPLRVPSSPINFSPLPLVSVEKSKTPALLVSVVGIQDMTPVVFATVKMVESREEFKNLPKPRGGYA